jgi:hypothetical protein
MKEGKQPESLFRDFLGFLIFFQLLVAVSAVASIFGLVPLTHFAERKFSFPPTCFQKRLPQVDVPLRLRITTQLASLIC